MSESKRSKPNAKNMRRFFFSTLLQQIRILWPLFSGILVIIIGSGIVVGYIEDWRIDESLYFTFVTGLTIGYGDFVPKHLVTRLLSLLIGFSGIVLTGLVAAVAVRALNATDDDRTK
ncbi:MULTISPECIES: potassium channel family protein [unclassified Rhizobium]|uniref:potassium channel family protein n=1 Tax=unclassified Rhizobium TaxID=2613769 RepID=UPI000A7C05B6|nr:MULTISPECIES: potassium channel family protein [unclassified Rhizobium]